MKSLVVPMGRAADALGISRTTLHNKTAKGEIVRYGDGVPLSEMKRYLDREIERYEAQAQRAREIKAALQ